MNFKGLSRSSTYTGKFSRFQRGKSFSINILSELWKYEYQYTISFFVGRFRIFKYENWSKCWCPTQRMFSKTEVNYLKPSKKTNCKLPHMACDRELFLFYWLQNLPVNLSVSLMCDRPFNSLRDTIIHTAYTLHSWFN